MKARIRTLLLAIIGILASACVRADTYELWAAGTLTNGGQGIARYSGTNGAFLGYFMHPTNGVGTLVNPGDGTIGKVETDGTQIYVSHGPQGFTVARYDRSGNNAAVDLIAGPAGNWHQGKYWYEIRGLGFTTNHIYVLAGVHTVAPVYPELERGANLFRHTLTGAAAGIQPPTTPTSYSRGAQFSAPTNFASVTGYNDLALDSSGNVYAAKSGPWAVYRFAPDGQYYGPGGLGDTTPWITTNVMPASFAIADILVDSANRLYLAGNAGGLTQSAVLRFNQNGTVAGTNGTDAVFTRWVNYLKGVGFPTAMAISPVDGYLYVGNAYINAPTRYENMINRFYTSGTNDGKMVGPDGGFANLGGAGAALEKPNNSLFFVRIPTGQGSVFSVR